MSATRSSLLLDIDTWDVCLDASRNIALAQPPYAVAQSVANAIKLFKGECFYATNRGVPYFGQVLGKQPPLALFKALMVQAALSVPGVVSAVCYVDKFTARAIQGQVLITDADNVTQAVAF